MVRGLIAFVATSLVVSGAVAQEYRWEREDFDNGIAVALAGNANDALAAVRCIDGELNIFFQVPKSRLDAGLKPGDGIVDLNLRIDDADDVYWARTSLFVSVEDYVAADYGGSDAWLWANEIAGARSAIEMSLTLATGETVDRQFNVEMFSAANSTATTREMIDGCGE